MSGVKQPTPGPSKRTPKRGQGQGSQSKSPVVHYTSGQDPSCKIGPVSPGSRGDEEELVEKHRLVTTFQIRSCRKEDLGPNRDPVTDEERAVVTRHRLHDLTKYTVYYLHYESYRSSDRNRYLTLVCTTGMVIDQVDCTKIKIPIVPSSDWCGNTGNIANPFTFGKLVFGSTTVSHTVLKVKKQGGRDIWKVMGTDLHTRLDDFRTFIASISCTSTFKMTYDVQMTHLFSDKNFVIEPQGKASSICVWPCDSSNSFLIKDEDNVTIGSIGRTATGIILIDLENLNVDCNNSTIKCALLAASLIIFERHLAPRCFGCVQFGEIGLLTVHLFILLIAIIIAAIVGGVFLLI